MPPPRPVTPPGRPPAAPPSPGWGAASTDAGAGSGVDATTGTRLADPLTPQEMASALASSQTPPAARPAAGQNIGVMPNLRAIVDHFLPAV